jgi:butyryl-CoA dehydrogenase
VDFRLSEEQEAFRRAVARFVDAEVTPAAAALDAAGEFPLALFRRLGEQGYLGLRYPEAVGGVGADFLTYCLFAEEMARGSMSLAALAAMQGLMGTHFVFKHGTDALRERYLAPALRGELVATFALTEPTRTSGTSRPSPSASTADGVCVAPRPGSRTRRWRTC